MKCGENLGNRVEGLAEQGIGQTGHRYSAAPALAVKRADHVVGEARGLQGSGHKSWGELESM